MTPKSLGGYDFASLRVLHRLASHGHPDPLDASGERDKNARAMLRAAVTLMLAASLGATVLAVPAHAAAGTKRDCEPAPAQPDPNASAPTETSGETPSSPPPAAAPGPTAPVEAGPAQQPTAEPTATDAAAPTEAYNRRAERIKCLDESLIDEFGRTRVRKGVQTRPFRKALRVSVSAVGGGIAGDLLDTGWQGGGNLAFWISEEFGIDGEFRVSPFTYRLERSATGFSQQDRYPNGQIENLAYIAQGHLLWAPLHTKLRASETKIVHADFVLFAGAGRTFHDTVQGAGFDLGASLYFYPTRWLSVRIDLSDHILTQELFGSRRISNNLLFSTGIGVWVPFRR